jgi:hypothetical protein
MSWHSHLVLQSCCRFRGDSEAQWARRRCTNPSSPPSLPPPCVQTWNLLQRRDSPQCRSRSVNAIAIGSQHKTMSAISHRIARSDDPKKWPSPQISASTTALTSLAVPQAGVRRPHIAGTAGGTECIEVGQAFEKSCLIDRPLRRAKHSKGVTLLRREAYYRLCSRLQPSRKWPNAANG